MKLAAGVLVLVKWRREFCGSSHLPYTCGVAPISSREVHRASIEQEGRHNVLVTGPKVEVEGLKLDGVCEPPTRGRLKRDVGLVDTGFTG